MERLHTMAPRVISSVEELKSLLGQRIGSSDWVEVTQEQIQKFADATGDHQWIHCDPQRAKLESPYGVAIAHGFLTLSLAPALSQQISTFEGLKLGVNYGLNRVLCSNKVCRVKKSSIYSVILTPGPLTITTIAVSE